LSPLYDALRCFTRRKSREKWVKSRANPETVTLLTNCLQIAQVRKPLEFLRIYGLFVAGAEGIEPSAYGFGGLHDGTRKRLITLKILRFFSVLDADRCFAKTIDITGFSGHEKMPPAIRP